MSAKTMWVSDRTWRDLSPALRQQLCSVLGKSEVVKQYACNVESALRDRGVPEVAEALLQELAGEDSAYDQASRGWPNG